MLNTFYDTSQFIVGVIVKKEQFKCFYMIFQNASLKTVT